MRQVSDSLTFSASQQAKLTSQRNDSLQCVDVTSSLQSCGGCSMHRNEDGEVEQAENGTDCTSLRNVKGVECYDSRCLISEFNYPLQAVITPVSETDSLIPLWNYSIL